MEIFKKSIFTLIAFILLNINCSVFSSELFVTPISQYVLNDSVANLTLINISKEEGYFSYNLSCVINGEKLLANECAKYFDFDLTSYITQDKNIVSIPANSQIKKQVTLKWKPEKNKPFYALFTPLFTLKDIQNKKNNMVEFNFRFAPGILFAYNPQKEELKTPIFKTVIAKNGVRSVKFQFDLNSLKYPQVINVNAKIIDKKTMKMIRFVDLARDKIIDQTRKTLILKEEIDQNKSNEKSICYVLYIVEKLTKSVYKIQSKC